MLTNNQQRVATHMKGHAKVLAAAGSGKTTTMIQRVINLVNSGVESRRIVSVMFNKDAANGYKAKLLKTYEKSVCPQVFTFHGQGSLLLNRLVEDGHLSRGKLVTSEYKLQQAAKEALWPWVSEIKGWRKKVNEFIGFVDLVKSGLGTPKQTFAEYGFPATNAYFVQAFQSFEAKRSNDKTWYFSDLIYLPVKFFHENPDKAEKYTNYYDHVIVDEFQDISDIQMALVKHIAGKEAFVMAVGDDDQCIYTWRGAKPDYLVSGFDKHFPNPTVFTLNETFRYGHQLSMAAGYLIKNNIERASKVCVSSKFCKPTDIALDIESIANPTVPRHVQEWIKGGGKVTDIAVLVRSFSHGVPVELALLNAGIPYRVEGGVSLFESEDIGAIVVGLHQAAGTFDSMPDQRKIKLARLFIRTPALGLRYDEEAELMGEIIKNLDDISVALDNATFQIKEKFIKERVHKRAACWRNLVGMKNRSAEEVYSYIYDSLDIDHYISYVSKSEEEELDRHFRYESFMAYIQHMNMDVTSFSQHVENISASMAAGGDDSDEALLITSVHRSKGLEWPMVIMPGLTQGKFPLIPRVQDRPYNVEDERRLFYVGMTRAQRKLILITANDQRLKKSLGMGSDQPPEGIERDQVSASQFLYETNLFVSQRADRYVSGKEKIPDGIKSPVGAKEYLFALGRRDRATA